MADGQTNLERPPRPPPSNQSGNRSNTPQPQPDSQPATDSSTPPSPGSGRPLLPAALVSFLFHVALLLLLSLVALGTGETSRISELTLSEPSETVSLEETPSFDLSPLPTFDDVVTEPVADIEMPEMTAPVFESAEEASEPTESEESPGEGNSETTDAMVGIPVARARIQERVSRAGGRKGEVQFALAWTNVNDVDLHVIEPSGERVWHMHKRSRSGGTLDVDMNVRGESTEPVENVRWITNAPWGRYTILVNLFQIHRGDTRTSRKSDIQLLAQLGKESLLEEDDVSTRGNQIAVFRFHYVPQTLPPMERQRLLTEIERLQQREESSANALLQSAGKEGNPRQKDLLLSNIVRRFPHTDAAIEAMQMIRGVVSKRGL